jgi:AAA domain
VNVDELHLEGRLSAAAGRLASNVNVYEALLRGLPVARERLDAEVLTAIGEPLEGEPLELDEELALRIEVAPRPAEDPERADGPVFVDLREREMRDVHWHDRPFLPAGELVTNNADGDTGKGLLSVLYAARFSRGEFGERRMVVFAVAEDDFETVLKPRLVAAEANLAYVRCVGWRRKGTEDALRIPDDVPVLEQHLQTMSVGLFVIDPLLSHLSAKTNTHVDHEVKLALRPVMQLAHNLGCAALGNGHFGKEKAAGARRASMGSTAFTNTPRVGLAMAYDDEDPDVRVVEVIKSNIGPKGVGRNYRLKTVGVDGLAEQLPLLVAESAATKSVDELIRAARWTKRIPGELVRELVLAELKTGEKSRQYLDTVSEEKLGASHDTVYQSGLTPLRKEGLIVARKESKDGPWLWRLKPDEEASL